MSKKLKPCPFCGSEEVYVEEYEHHPGVTRYRVLCAGCMAGVDTGTRQEPGWAVEDWNRRSERTCNVESSHVELEHGDHAYLEVELSCGHYFTWDDGTPPDYCPYCGARLEGVER